MAKIEIKSKERVYMIILKFDTLILSLGALFIDRSLD